MSPTSAPRLIALFPSRCHPENRHQRKETERFKSFAYEDLLKCDKVNLDIFWLKDESLEDAANLPTRRDRRESPKTSKPPSTSSPESTPTSSANRRRRATAA